MSRLYDITQNVYKDGYNDGVEDHSEYQDKRPHKFKETVAPEEANQQIKALMLELIGEDEKHLHYRGRPDCGYFDHLYDDECSCGITAQNNHRDELRQKVEAL